MPCHIMKWGNGAVIACGSGRRQEPCFARANGCDGAAQFQCDFPIDGKKTCDRYCCKRHCKEVGPDRHYCLEHALRKQGPLPGAQAFSTESGGQ